MKTVLTIAGTDPSGGAGIQADLKTMTAHHIYGMSAITAVVSQNTTGVNDIVEMTPAFLARQLDDVFSDIFPDAVKIGMVSSRPLIAVIAEKLRHYQPKNIVLDPVMVASAGSKLIDDAAIDSLKEALIPLACVITPNIPEMAILAQMPIHSEADMLQAAAQVARRYHCAVLCKGGHQLNDANDLLCTPDNARWFHGKRIATRNTHGTGCTLSSAIACNLAKGDSLPDAVRKAKAYLSGALAAMLDLGKGCGPMDHAFAIAGDYDSGDDNFGDDNTDNTPAAGKGA